ncbi:MAG: zinc dependent phospholipase C family protein [Desulfovibrionaceae bacterium]
MKSLQFPPPQTSHARRSSVVCAMPKEHVHFLTAQLSADRLQTSRFAPDIAAHSSALFLGSIFHDVLFYLRGNQPQALRELPHALHGKQGQDTYHLLLLQTSHAAVIGGQARAFLVGMVSHIQADAALHPLVYHLSGAYYRSSEAVERHRLLETLLDQIIAGSRTELRQHSIGHLLRSAGGIDAACELAPLDSLAELTGCRKKHIRSALKHSWRTFSTLRCLALTPVLGPALAGLRPLLPKKAHNVRGILALFHPRRPRTDAAFLLGPVHYRHPVTGLEHVRSIRELMDEAAERTAELCRELEPLAFGEINNAVLAFGPSLDTGLPHSAVNNAHHFANPPYPPLT